MQKYRKICDNGASLLKKWKFECLNQTECISNTCFGLWLLEINNKIKYP